MTYVILEFQGKQYQVKEGDRIVVDKLPYKENEEFESNKILFLNDGKDIKVGSPYLGNVKIKMKFLRTLRGEKIIVFKKRSKKGYKKTLGFRPWLSEVLIESIDVS